MSQPVTRKRPPELFRIYIWKLDSCESNLFLLSTVLIFPRFRNLKKNKQEAPSRNSDVCPKDIRSASRYVEGHCVWKTSNKLFLV